MTNHPNRSNVIGAGPTAEEVRDARRESGLSAAKAGALIHTTGRVWFQWEAGERRMHPAFWELWLIKSARVR